MTDIRVAALAAQTLVKAGTPDIRVASQSIQVLQRVQPAPDPPATSVMWWDGSAVQPAELLGWWDGSAVQPAELLGWWDGSAVQPLA